MPAFAFRSGQNAYSSGVSGGTVPTANIIPDFAGWAAKVDPTMTPILSAITGKSTRDQRTFFWGQSKFTSHSSLVAGAGLVDGTGTSLVVTTGDGVLFQKYNVLELTNQIAGSVPARYDSSTKEIVWVSADPSTDTLTIVRAQGGTSGVAHPAGAKIEILAVAEPQLQDHTISPVTRGFQYSNNFERFAGSVKMDLAFRNMPTYEYSGDQLLNDIRNETIRLKLLLEKSVIRGGKQAGNPSTPLPELMGGFLSYITTNVYNQNGNTLSAAALETAMRDMYKRIDDGAPKTYIMGPDTASIFDTYLNPYRRVTSGETTATMLTERVRFRWGTYDVMVSRWMPEGTIAVVDFSKMELVTFKGADWHTDMLPTSGDYEWMSISGDKSLIVKEEVAMGLITNFITDLDQYPGRSYLG